MKRFKPTARSLRYWAEVDQNVADDLHQLVRSLYLNRGRTADSDVIVKMGRRYAAKARRQRNFAEKMDKENVVPLRLNRAC